MPNRLPELPADHLSRPRLCERLLQGAPRLRLLCAPAGSGKSMLLRECARNLPDQVSLCWLDLRGKLQTAPEFLQRMAASLGLQVASEASIEAFLAHCERPLWIMVDHLCLSHDGSIEALLGRLLQHSSAQVGWWVACRHRPTWPLTRLLLGGDLLEIDARQLALSEYELAELLERQTGADRHQSATELMQQTRGWFAGIRLSLLAARQANGPASAEQLLLSYLESELLTNLHELQRDTLCLLACLPSFDSGLHQSLFELDAPLSPLPELINAGAFIEPVPQGSGYWRVHPAVAPVLANSLPQQRRAWLYRKACWHHAKCQDIQQAVRYALLAEQPEVAISLLERINVESLLDGEGPGAFLRWREQLPDELLYGTPELVLLQAWALLLAGRLEQAQDCMDRLAIFLPSPCARRHAELVARWQVLYGNLLCRRGLPVSAAEPLRDALQYLPPETWGERVMAWLPLIEQAHTEGMKDEAQRLTATVALEVRERRSLILEAMLVLQHSQQLERRGELLRTESQINRVVAELGTANSLMGGRALLNQARNLWRQGRAIEARECYAQALRLSSASRDPVSAWAQAGLAELDAAEGNLDQAFERLGEATRDMQLQRVSEVLYRPVLDLLRAKLWLLDGQHRRSAELASEYLALGQDRPGWRLEPLGLTVCQQFELLQARAAVANDEDQAKIFEAWQQQALRAGHPWQACEFGFALAEAHLAFGRQRKAQAALFDALAQARRNGGTGREYYWHSIRPEIGRWVSKVEAAATLDADDDVGQLSRREHSVLTMIAEGLANQEIAERLHISLHTVKSHAQRINSKLGVTRRAQAVVRAKSLGLVR